MNNGLFDIEIDIDLAINYARENMEQQEKEKNKYDFMHPEYCYHKGEEEAYRDMM